MDSDDIWLHEICFSISTTNVVSKNKELTVSIIQGKPEEDEEQIQAKQQGTNDCNFMLVFFC